jgi:HNH endonuclease/NUMOD4 motif
MPDATNKSSLTVVWKTVPEFDRYEVSNMGGIRRKGYHGSPSGYRKEVTYGTLDHKKYRRVRLRAAGKGYSRLVHRLVLTAFVGPCPTGMETNHVNGVRDDNRLENLEWVTPSQNVQHAYDTLKRFRCYGERHGNSSLSEAVVTEARKRYSSGERICDIARALGATWESINYAVKRLTWAHIP